MKQLLHRARNKSQETRERLAIIITLIILLIIVGGWLLTKATLHQTSRTGAEKNQRLNPFSLLRGGFQGSFDRGNDGE